MALFSIKADVLSATFGQDVWHPGSVFRGTEQDDRLRDSGQTDLGGDDAIYGYGGNDLIYAMNGNDMVFGGAGHDTIVDAGNGNDMFFGGDGNDSFWMKDGNNTVDGGDGRDMVAYASSTSGVSIDLQLGTTYAAGRQDTLYSIEDAWGSQHADVIRGSAGANALTGYGGDDYIDGGAGNDTITGGAGSDVMKGGQGADRFVFGSMNDFPIQNWDTIKDFEHGVDKIDLSALDARPGTAGRQAFTFDSSRDGATEEFFDGFSDDWQGLITNKDGPVINGDTGEIETRYENGYTYVFLSTGDGLTEAAFRLEGDVHLTASDFVL